MLLVFGSINVDLLFQVETLPRPGETVLCPGYEVAAGGKGANQAAAARAGAAVRMVGTASVASRAMHWPGPASIAPQWRSRGEVPGSR